MAQKYWQKYWLDLNLAVVVALGFEVSFSSEHFTLAFASI